MCVLWLEGAVNESVVARGIDQAGLGGERAAEGERDAAHYTTGRGRAGRAAEEEVEAVLEAVGDLCHSLLGQMRICLNQSSYCCCHLLGLKDLLCGELCAPCGLILCADAVADSPLGCLSLVPEAVGELIRVAVTELVAVHHLSEGGLLCGDAGFGVCAHLLISICAGGLVLCCEDNSERRPCRDYCLALFTNAVCLFDDGLPDGHAL